MIMSEPIKKDEEMRCKICNVAERLFREIGYQKTTVADIAKSLAMSPANVYRFFASKHQINEAVGKRLVGEVEEGLAAVVAQNLPASERIRVLFLTLHTMTVERYVADVKMHEMVEVALTESWEMVHAHVMKLIGFTANIIADGVASGEFRACNVEETAASVNASMIRFCHPRMVMECGRLPLPTLEGHIDFILHALKA